MQRLAVSTLSRRCIRPYLTISPPGPMAEIIRQMQVVRQVQPRDGRETPVAWLTFVITQHAVAQRVPAEDARAIIWEEQQRELYGCILDVDAILWLHRYINTAVWMPMRYRCIDIELHEHRYSHIDVSISIRLHRYRAINTAVLTISIRLHRYRATSTAACRCNTASSISS